ncbi:YnbE family lipoprotein [Insolitispirillum peregrinum]|uniref:YnbE-like lipoprotein n=1 Tax=Insolitispirillum peregrinum TaxID=80876 RepID=A0A1N7IT44_9PROT|nr:YnbE family lipoprotein [Insolitispirillum peregrinum]SIS40265.1 YnbE-like lipoprotein [Insolitispirillum peregrinum]
MQPGKVPGQQGRLSGRVRACSRTLILASLLGVAACQPTIKVEAPDKPIVINLNVKIEQEVRIKVEKDVDSLLEQNNELF